MGTMANRVDPNEMPHKAAFHQGLHCLLMQNRSSEKENSSQPYKHSLCITIFNSLYPLM